MSFWNKIIESIKGNEDFSELKSSKFRDFLNGSILSKNFITKQYRLLLMIAALAVIYIGNIYYCEKQIAKEVELKKRLQDVKYEALTVSAELTKLSRRTYVLDYINSKGLELKESPIAPVIIQKPNPKKDAEIIKAIDEHKAATDIVKKDTTYNEETIEQ